MSSALRRGAEAFMGVGLTIVGITGMGLSIRFITHVFGREDYQFFKQNMMRRIPPPEDKKIQFDYAEFHAEQAEKAGMHDEAKRFRQYVKTMKRAADVGKRHRALALERDALTTELVKEARARAPHVE